MKTTKSGVTEQVRWFENKPNTFEQVKKFLKERNKMKTIKSLVELHGYGVKFCEPKHRHQGDRHGYFIPQLLKEPDNAYTHGKYLGVDEDGHSLLIPDSPTWETFEKLQTPKDAIAEEDLDVLAHEQFRNERIEMVKAIAPCFRTENFTSCSILTKEIVELADSILAKIDETGPKLEALDLPVQKDKEGHQLMLKMSKHPKPANDGPGWKV